jgi:hypothetical protein
MAIKEWLRANPAYKPFLIYSALSLTVLLPMLLPGHILTLDMEFGREIQPPGEVTASYLFKSLLHVLSIVIPAEIIEKVLLFTILVTSGVGMHKFARSIDSAETLSFYISGALYMINPFTYSRFMAGQYSVLLGYALLPFFVRALLGFLARPAPGSMSWMTLWVVLISIVSIHSLGLVMLVSLIAVVLSLWRYRHQRNHLFSLLKYGLIAGVVFFAASSYWLVPTLTGNGKTLETISTFTQGDQQAFATVGENSFRKVANVIRLQGFWAEARDLYLLPQERLVGWGVVVLGVWALVITGAIVLWKKGERFLVVLLGLSSLIACFLAVGTVNEWLARHMPFFAGYREPHKFVGLIALAYTLCTGKGVTVTIQWLQKHFGETTASTAIGVLIILPIALTPTMFWGFNGQLTPRQYPADWFMINERLNQDPSRGKILFLPWHQYMYFDFAERIIANPADQFFDKPVLVSNNPEFKGSASGNSNPLVQRLDREVLPQANARQDLGALTAPLGIQYIILAKEVDADNYAYLDRQKDLRLVSESATLKLYRNEAYREE